MKQLTLLTLTFTKADLLALVRDRMHGFELRQTARRARRDREKRRN